MKNGLTVKLLLLERHNIFSVGKDFSVENDLRIEFIRVFGLYALSQQI